MRHLNVFRLGFGIAILVTALAADWPRFRGPNGTGAATDKRIPVQWSAEDVLWKVPIGAGHSSPIVTGGRIFLQSANRDERLLVCVDANSGKTIWSKAVPGGEGHTHEKNSHASSTPATDGKQVYAVFWNGKEVSLFAYTINGKLAWKRNLGPFKSQHGPGFSPIVHDGLVIVNNDQDGSAVLKAFEAKTGKPAWEAKRKAFRACYSTPFISEGPGGNQLIVASTAGITAYDPKDATVLWTYEWAFSGMPLRTVGSAIEADGKVFAASGDGRGDRHLIAVKQGGKGDVTKTNLVWEKTAGTPYVPTLLAHNKHLFAVTDQGFAVCYAAKDGKEIWRRRLGKQISASPILINGNVYSPDERGDVFIFEATPKGFKLTAKKSIGEPIYASPAVADGRLIIRGDKHLFCIGKKK
jgi:outer membrane protein assembly factor BamB